MGGRDDEGSSSRNETEADPLISNDNNDYNPDASNNNSNGMLIPAGTDDSATTKKRATSRQTGGGTADDSPTKNGSGVPGTRRRIRKSIKDAGSSDDENVQAKCIKYSALFLLVAQMVGLVLLMRYSRTARSESEPLYLASTAVFIMEVMKLVICLGVVLYQTGTNVIHELYHHTIGSPLEIVQLCIPSLLYTVQNNLLYLALTNLDAATYQVCYQLKILTTALFSALLLQRKFSSQKWAALVLLTVGVAIVQLSGSGDQHTTATDHNEGGGSEQDQRHAEELVAAATKAAHQNRWIGLIAVICAACTSGFSGVYFERILKGSRTSLWIRNVQMGLPSILIAYITIYFKDAAAIQKQGFLGGYNTIVWTVVVVQAVGGLIVATVVKYADNVLKVFATSFSIVISCIISAFMFDFHPTMSFLVGASLVVTSTVMYSSPERKVRRKSLLPMTSRK